MVRVDSRVKGTQECQVT